MRLKCALERKQGQITRYGYDERQPRRRKSLLLVADPGSFFADRNAFRPRGRAWNDNLCPTTGVFYYTLRCFSRSRLLVAGHSGLVAVQWLVHECMALLGCAWGLIISRACCPVRDRGKEIDRGGGYGLAPL